mgnify:CR=1 FL=1|jgi:phage baseplate assembly protein W
MENPFSFGINFPFSESKGGKYLGLTESTSDEIRAILIHLLLTRKGTRYYLPSFGTRLYEYIFEPMDSTTFNRIENEVTTAVEEFIPNVTINKIEVTPYLDTEESPGEYVTGLDERLYRTAADGTEEYTVKLRIDYSNNNGQFSQRDYIIINL